MIIDANIFKGYFQIVIGATHTLCGCPKTLIESATPNNPIYHDDNDIIASEWRQVVDREWFDPWLADQLEAGTIAFAEREIDTGLEKNLHTNGFPKSRDIIYIRLGLGIQKIGVVPAKLFSEDIDFYEPKQKGGPSTTRTKTLKSSSGSIAKILKKRGILVQCVP